jgi:hypothetical protein
VPEPLRPPIPLVVGGLSFWRTAARRAGNATVTIGVKQARARLPPEIPPTPKSGAYLSGRARAKPCARCSAFALPRCDRRPETEGVAQPVAQRGRRRSGDGLVTEVERYAIGVSRMTRIASSTL